MSHRNEINAVLKQVENWPTEDRCELVREVLDTIPPAFRRIRPSFAGILGIARGNGPAPTDEQVEQWIDEHRMEKYGR